MEGRTEERTVRREPAARDGTGSSTSPEAPARRAVLISAGRCRPHRLRLCLRPGPGPGPGSAVQPCPALHLLGTLHHSISPRAASATGPGGERARRPRAGRSGQTRGAYGNTRGAYGNTRGGGSLGSGSLGAARPEPSAQGWSFSVAQGRIFPLRDT